MDFNENSPLLLTVSETFEEHKQNTKGLSVFFAVLCIVDIFGVFPIVALPKAIILCGWSGIPLVIFIFFIQIYTAILLGKCWVIAEYLDKDIVKKNRYPYAALAEMTYGKQVARLVTILLDVTIFGGGIPNLIVAAQNLQLFGVKMSDSQFDVSYCYWIILLGIVLCPFLWLGSPKDMKALCFISAIIVFSISIMIWVCIYNDNTVHVVSPITQFENLKLTNVISAYGILAFQFDIHPMLLTIQVDMKDRSKIAHIVICGFLVTTFLFTLTTVFAALKYGTDTYPNILQGLPPSLVLYVTVLLVTAQLCMTSAVGNSALYQHIEDILNIPRDFNYRRCLIRSSLTALAVFVAESVPKFDLVMSLIGGTLTGPLMFIFPPLFYIKMSSLKRQHISNMSLQTANHIMYHCDSSNLSENACNEKCFDALQDQESSIDSIDFVNEKNYYYICKMLIASVIILFGVFATCTTTYLNISDAFRYATFSPPCLYNLTTVLYP